MCKTDIEPSKEKSQQKFSTGIIFLVFNVWVLIFTFIQRPVESLIGTGIILAGLIIYLFDKTQKPDNDFVSEISEHI